jgi:hypothetical protein
MFLRTADEEIDDMEAESVLLRTGFETQTPLQYSAGEQQLTTFLTSSARFK